MWGNLNVSGNYSTVLHNAIPVLYTGTYILKYRLVIFKMPLNPIMNPQVDCCVADSDPGSGAFYPPRIRIPDPGGFFFRIPFLGSRIQDIGHDEKFNF
jgi:hypothetical protein